MPATTPRLRRTALLLAVALVGSILIAGPAQAKPPRAAAATPPVDISGSMPRASRGEVTYDFLGRGYGQRLIAEDGNLNLYDAPAKGGSKLKSVAVDLAPPPFSVDIAAPGGGDNQVYMYDSFSNEGDLSCDGCLEQRADDHGFNTIYLVVLNGWLYISGTKGSYITGAGNPDNYRNILYKVPLDLECAQETCARQVGKVADLPAVFGGNQRIIGTTALAGGFSGPNPYLAVGLTDTGVLILDANLATVSQFGGMVTPQIAQTPTTALAWAPAGSGKLAVGVLSYYNEGFFVNVNAAGAVGSFTTWFYLGNDQLYSSPLSVAFGRRADGSLIAVFGNSGGVSGDRPAGLWLVDPNQNQAAIAAIAVPGDGVATVQAVPRTDGSSGGDDFAVYSEAGFGSLIRYDQANNAFRFLPLQPPSPAAGTPTQLPVDAWRSWFPGYKTGQFVLANTSGDDVDVTLQVRPDAGYGCWFAPTFVTSSTFPSAGLRVSRGQTTPVFTMGGLTAGPSGLCAADDNTALWRGYLVVTPVDHPADARIVNVQLGRDLTVDVTDQVGGSTTVSAAKTANAGALGQWTLTISGPAAPTAVSAPTCRGGQPTPIVANARRITTNIRNRTTVYRIDLNCTQWTVPGAGAGASPARLQAAIPPIGVLASVNGSDYDLVGTFLPPGRLSSSGTTVTTSGGTFFWENPAGAPAYTQLRVQVGERSSDIVLGGLPGPTAPSTPITGLLLTATKTNSATANVVPNGLDQAQLNVQINAGTLLPATDPAYDTVYYRDEDQNLVTNLYQPGEFDEFVGVQPAAGAYPNTGVSAPRGRAVGRARPVGAGQSFDYVSTNSAAERVVTGWVGVGSPIGTNSSSITVNDQAVEIAPDPGAKASVGFSLEGCTDFSASSTCAVASVTRTQPALYQAGSDRAGPLLGAQFAYQAQNAVSDLPLQWPANTDAQKLAPSGISLLNRSALIKLTNANAYLPGNSVDLIVVSHGETVAATVPVF